MATAQASLVIDQEPIRYTRVLLCEGGGDRNVFQELIKARALPDFYVIHPREGVDPGGRQGFSQRLRGLRTQPGFDQITGVVVASDNDTDGSFEEVRTLIHNADYPSPNHRLRFIARSPTSPAVAVMMIPLGEHENGQLETLCLKAIKDEWPTQFECATKYAQCANIGAWSRGKQERAQMRALISHICKKDPNTSLSHLWHDNRETVVPLDHAVFTPIADFLSGFDAAIAAL